MTDHQIASYVDFIHDSGCGRGGFRIHVFSNWKLYEERVILTRLEGEYVNPVGPFRKYINISANLMTANETIGLRYKKEFWESCSEQVFLSDHLIPFLSHLRELVHYNIDPRSLSAHSPEYSGSRTELPSEDKENFDFWLTNIVK